MTSWTLIRRSLRFHWRSHLGVLLGAAIGSAALLGALIVGDSVRETLRQRAVARLANADNALYSNDRFFREELGLAFKSDAGEASATLLRLPGTVANADGTARANNVQVFGVRNFFTFARPRNVNDEEWRRETDLPVGSMLLNAPLAQRLNAQVGDTLLVRVQKPSALSRDAVITPQSDHTVALRLRVNGIVDAAHGGDLDLQVSQLPAMNAFVRLNELADAAGIPAKANMVLVKDGAAGNDRNGSELDAKLKSSWRLEDAQLNIASLSNASIQLGTPRIFLDEPVARSAANASSNAVPLLTYLVNQLRAGTNTTPYSMVTAAGAPYTPADLRDDEIVLNQWLSEDLAVKPGDSVALTYYVADEVSKLTERTNVFRVRSIVPLDGIYADKTLMPEFPGLAKAESTHDWDAGFPLVHKIREKDEAYWKQHRGTPKAFVSLRAGQAMWANRFGSLTAVRWTVPTGMSAQQFAGVVQQNLMANLNPADLGFQFEPVRARALRAVSQSQDFGGLFIGFSFFLIVAALILMGLLFAFGVQQRAPEIGTLLAVGFTPRKVRRIFLLEGAALAFIGSVIGVAGGIFYARAMLHGLTTVWRSATNATALNFHVSPTTIGTGLVAGTIVAVITIWLVLRKQARQPARALLAGDWSAEADLSGGRKPARRSGIFRALMGRVFAAPILGWGSLALAAATVIAAFATGETSNAEYFFSAGSFALIGGLALTSSMLARVLRHSETLAGSRRELPRVTFRSLATHGTARRRTRSVATVALLASGVFLIVSIGAFRLDADANAFDRKSGTGGFALIGESTLPIVKDLNTREGRDALGLDEKALEGVRFVPFRVREGDDASCLNLNRAQQPRLLGVSPALLSQRFQFATKPNLSSTPARDASDSWAALDWQGYVMHGSVRSPSMADPAVPAIGDAASIQWALGKKVGDTLTYTDARGSNFAVRLVGGLANSMMQGSLIIDEAEFTRRFPGISGYRMFLIDCPSNALPAVSAELTRALQDYGFEVTPAAQRLAAFNAVQNTYLNTFQVLGGIGLLLGSFGLGIVVLRNVLERRGELALLAAVGFRQARVQQLVLAEHAALLALGLVIGIGAALVAIAPSVMSPSAAVPVGSLTVTLGGVLLFGLVATWLATRGAVKGNLLGALRNE